MYWHWPFAKMHNEFSFEFAPHSSFRIGNIQINGIFDRQMSLDVYIFILKQRIYIKGRFIFSLTEGIDMQMRAIVIVEIGCQSVLDS